MWHVARPGFGHSKIEDRPVGIRRSDDHRIVNSKRALSRPRLDGLRFMNRHVERQVNLCRSATVETMAMSTVDVQVRPGAFAEISRPVEGVDQLRPFV